MPAAAQIQMINALIESYKHWNVVVHGGRNIKFSQAIVPGELIHLTLSRINPTTAQFTLVKQDASMASKGKLILARNNFD